MKIRTVTLGTALAMISMVGLLAPANLASASEKGRKNTAIGLGAAAVHQLLNGKTTNGVLLGAGAAYAYKRYKDSEKENNRNKRVNNYRSNSASSYRSRNAYGGSSIGGARGSVRRNGSAYGQSVLTGRIVDDTDLTSRRILIDKDGVEYRVDVPRNAMVYQAGARASLHDLREGDVVRVTATPTDDKRWRASRVDVIRSAGVHDYDARETRPATSRYSGVGVIRSVDESGRSFEVQVGENLRTVYTDQSRFDGVSSMIDLQPGDRVRVQGNMDGRDVIATDITLLN